MDKSWMDKSRSSPEYLNGVTEFLNFAFDHATNDDKIPCPCIKCCNKYYKNREDVHGYVCISGMNCVCTFDMDDFKLMPKLIVAIAKNAAKGIAETQNVGSDVEPVKEGEEIEKSVDGEQLESGADGGELVIWKMHPTDDGRTWKVLKTLSFHRKDVVDLQWSTDGAFLVSGSVDNSCIIWDASKGSIHQTFDSHLHYVQGVAWDSLGQYLASISSDRTCRIYLNKPTGTAKGIKKMHYVCQNVLSKFEQQIVDDSKLQLTKSHLFHDETLPSFFQILAWSPDGSFLLVPAGTVLN
ncbi:hypothetical protein AAC387_Pa09g1016 [Persea americana]